MAEVILICLLVVFNAVEETDAALALAVLHVIYKLYRYLLYRKYDKD